MQIRNIIKVLMLVALTATGAERAVGQPPAMITLKSLDGSVVLVGELQGFEAGHYNIIVAGLGLISIAQDLMTCQSIGIDCATLATNS